MRRFDWHLLAVCLAGLALTCVLGFFVFHGG
jgi:hypothetical protein